MCECEKHNQHLRLRVFISPVENSIKCLILTLNISKDKKRKMQMMKKAYINQSEDKYRTVAIPGYQNKQSANISLC